MATLADTAAPTVSITAPLNNATVSGTAVTFSANASDNVGVAGVQFKFDGVNLGTEDTTSPYSLSIDTTTGINGDHTLTAVARDIAGNTKTSSAVAITVNNAPASVIKIGETDLSTPDSSKRNSLRTQKVTFCSDSNNKKFKFLRFFCFW